MKAPNLIKTNVLKPKKKNILNKKMNYYKKMNTQQKKFQMIMIKKTPVKNKKKKKEILIRYILVLWMNVILKLNPRRAASNMHKIRIVLVFFTALYLVVTSMLGIKLLYTTTRRIFMKIPLCFVI